jgi:hypothetical protein
MSLLAFATTLPVVPVSIIRRELAQSPAASLRASMKRWHARR